MNRWYKFMKVDTGSESGMLLNGRLNCEITNRKKMGFLVALYMYHRPTNVRSRLLVDVGDRRGCHASPVLPVAALKTED